MTSNTERIDEMLECAIREKGLKNRMGELDAQQKLFWSPTIKRVFYSAAACVILVMGGSFKLSNDAKTAGYTYDISGGQRGGAAIIALVEDRKFNEARDMIVVQLAELTSEAAELEKDSPEYIQLSEDVDELEFLNCICLLRQGKYFKARKALKHIVRGEGIYVNDAMMLLEKL